MLLLILITIWVIIVASTWWSGFWSNLILFVNMLIGALVATAFFLNVADALKSGDESLVFISPIIAIWILFFLTVIVCRTFTDTFSRLKLKFDIWTEMAGRSIMSLMVASLFVSFAAFTLHLAPLPPYYFPNGDAIGSVGGASVPLLSTQRPAGPDVDNDGPVTRLGPDTVWQNAVVYWSGWTFSESLSYCLINPLQDEEREFYKTDVDQGLVPVTVRQFKRDHLRVLDGWKSTLGEEVEQLRAFRR